jgi:hypothetical protein
MRRPAIQSAGHTGHNRNGFKELPACNLADLARFHGSHNLLRSDVMKKKIGDYRQ